MPLISLLAVIFAACSLLNNGGTSNSSEDNDFPAGSQSTVISSNPHSSAKLIDFLQQQSPFTESPGAVRFLLDCQSMPLVLDSEARVLVIYNNAYYLLGKLKSVPEAIALSQDGNYMAIGSGLKVELYTLIDFKLISTLAQHRSRSHLLRFSPNSKELMIAGYDAKIYRWKFSEQLSGGLLESQTSFLERYADHASAVGSLALESGGRLFFSGDWTGRLKAWLLYSSDNLRGIYDNSLLASRFFTDDKEVVNAVRTETNSIIKLELINNDQLLFLADEKGKFELWSVRGFKKIAELQAHSSLVYSVALKDRNIVSVGRDGFVNYWQINCSAEDQCSFIKIGNLADTSIRSLVFSNQKVYAGTLEGKVLEIASLNEGI